MNRIACLLLGTLGALPIWAQAPAKPDPAAGIVTLACEAVYLPARTSWTRTVTVAYDQQRVRSITIDGQAVYTFAIREAVILTSQDNERIQIDTAALTWTSDFRGLATGQGRCERS